MVYQSNSNGAVVYKAQAGLGTPASGSGASVLRISGGAGAKLSKAAIESREVRNDGLSTRGRHGTQKTASSYEHELSLGSADAIIEALQRGTWDASAFSKSQADFTSVTTTTSTIVIASGSFITAGFRVGDIVRGAGFPDAANNGKNLCITALTATVMTVAEALVANGVADTSFSITRVGKKLVNPATLVKRYFTLEEYEGDIDQSTTLQDFVWGSGKFQMSPNGLIMFDPGGVGTGQISGLATGSSPYFTSPGTTTGVPLSVVDATIRLNGTDLVELTSLGITMDIQPASPDVFGSGAIKYGPDVFTGPLKVGLDLGLLRKDLTFFQDFIAETQYSLHVLAVENESEPKDFLSIVVPNFTLGSVDPSAFSKQGGGRTQTISVPPALVGVDSSATGNNSMITFQTSAP